MSLAPPAVRPHRYLEPIAIATRDFEHFPTGVAFQLQCTCGWRGALETIPAFALLHGRKHLAA